MIEQLVSTQGSFIAEAIKQQPLAANNDDVMRFNMEMFDKRDASVQSNLLQDAKVDGSAIDKHLLTEKSSSTVSSPLARLDQSYRAIMSQMDDVPQFDKFLDIQQKKKPAAVRTNVEDIKVTDPAEEVKEMLKEQGEIRKAAGAFTKEISQWHIKAQIWSANIKILTTVVSQASQGFKTLFRSAG